MKLSGGSKARDVDVEALDEALNALAKIDQRKRRVVELRFFGGLSVDEIAAVLEISEETVKRDWRAAKAWLFRELTPKESACGLGGETPNHLSIASTVGIPGKVNAIPG